MRTSSSRRSSLVVGRSQALADCADCPQGDTQYTPLSTVRAATFEVRSQLEPRNSLLKYNPIVAAKTNAARLLDQLGIPYELREYQVDPEDLAAETVAVKIGLPPEQVFKTLVARPSGSKDPHGVCMAVIPGDQELDLKALASAAGEKKMDLVPVKELQGLTGYIRGGVTALAAKREFPVFVAETIELFDIISISAGMRGLQILLAPADYLRATKGTIAALAQPKKSGTNG